MQDLFFLPDRWEPDAMISSNNTKPVKVHGYLNRTIDAWQIGSWDSRWSAIESSIPVEKGWLEPGQEYRFCFCLNGGENSEGTETCMLEIFGDDWEDRLAFPLNRSITKPILYKNHWFIYAIPFISPSATEVLHFRFVASGAVCTIGSIPEMNMSVPESLTSDEPDTTHSQRHNLFYSSGWPEGKESNTTNNGNASPRSRKLLKGAVAAGTAAGVLLLCHMINNRRKKP
ncbi:MAG: hypothetical protein MJ071_01835 [Oscillospiraceae bacterium]|nr:hypothetical protein [Oscillospiraceae bacterium]